jgi:hypothetical protein
MVITLPMAPNLLHLSLSSARESVCDQPISTIPTDLVKLKYTRLVKMGIERTEKLGFLNEYRPERGPVIAGL